MAVDNFVSITGNCTRDPETRFTNGGTAVTTFGIANNRKWKNSADEWQEEPGFFDVTVWGKTGENVAESFSKGDRVVVTGRLSYRAWEDKEGNKRSKVEITADEVTASMRWATVAVTKTPYEGDDSSGNGEGRSGGSRSSGRGRKAEVETPDYGPDEEPF